MYLYIYLCMIIIYIYSEQSGRGVYSNGYTYDDALYPLAILVMEGGYPSAHPREPSPRGPMTGNYNNSRERCAHCVQCAKFVNDRLNLLGIVLRPLCAAETLRAISPAAAI